MQLAGVSLFATLVPFNEYMHFILFMLTTTTKTTEKEAEMCERWEEKRLLNLNMTLPQSPRTNDLANHKLAQEPVRRIVINHPSVTI